MALRSTSPGGYNSVCRRWLDTYCFILIRDRPTFGRATQIPFIPFYTSLYTSDETVTYVLFSSASVALPLGPVNAAFFCSGIRVVFYRLEYHGKKGTTSID